MQAHGAVCISGCMRGFSVRYGTNGDGMKGTVTVTVIYLSYFAFGLSVNLLQCFKGESHDEIK